MSSNSKHELNASDRSVLCLSRSLREAGYAGLTTQVQMWLRDRIDPAGLRGALARLNHAHPIVTARLIDPNKRSVCWRFRPGGECTLHEDSLAGAGEEETLRKAADLLSAGTDPTGTDPVQFHLLHRDDGDLFLMQYDHCLMDINGAKLLLRAINRLCSGEPGDCAHAETGEDGIATYLRRVSLRRRLAAVWRLGRQMKDFPRSVGLNLSDAAAPVPGGRLRIALRGLDERQTAAFTRRTLRVCGFPSLSLTVLASVGRAILRHTPHPVRGDSALVVYLGNDLRERGACGPIFHNLTSLLPLLVRPEDMGDRDGMILLLNRQLRERLRGDVDLAMLQLGWWLRKVAWLQRGAGRDVFFGQSVHYGYMGELVARDDCFCGVPVERTFPVAQINSPPGLSIAPTVCRGRLVLPAVFAADTVPPARSTAFLDTLAADLAGQECAGERRSEMVESGQVPTPSSQRC